MQKLCIELEATTRVWLLFVSLVLLLAGCPSWQESELATANWAERAADRLPKLEMCTLGGIAEPLLCGSFEVPEDRSLVDGRKLTLEVVVVPARQDDPPLDPVWLFEGGPGGAVTSRAAGSVFAGAVRARDIVLADQRGTGGSAEIDCDLEAQGTPGELREMYPAEPLRECIATLQRRADLKRYTSVDHAHDVEDLRQRLGYGKLNLRGGSYGTRAMMVYAQLYPQNVRTLFGIGVDSPLRSNLAERGVFADRTLRGIAELCAAAPACAALTPRLDQALEEVWRELETERPSVRVQHPTALRVLSATGEPLQLEVGAQWLSEQVRLVLYFAFTTRLLPWAVHQAQTARDWEPLTALALAIEHMFSSSLATGVALTVQCSEGMDFDVAEALARGENSAFGNVRLRQQVRGCALWPHDVVAPLGREDPQPIDAPTLFLSGAHDPVTPPEYAEDARTLFPASRHVVLAHGQHGPFDLEGAWPCVHQIWAELLDENSVEAMDLSCTEELRRPGFVVDEQTYWQVIGEELLGEL